MDINEITSKIMTEAMESEDEFIFTTIKPWCEEKMQKQISKRDLENALKMYFALEQEPRKDEVILTNTVLTCIELGIETTGHSDDYTMGFCNGLIWLKTCITGEEPKFFKKESEDKE